MDSAIAANLLSDLVQQHYALLYRYAFRLSGEAARAADLAQQTFLIAQIRLEQLRNTESSRNWLCAILRNNYLKEQRRAALAGFQSLSDIPEPADSEEVDSTVDCEQLQAALLELPEEFRSPLILFYFEEFSYRDIAQHMQIPLGTVMSRLARAKAILRKRLTKNGTTSSVDWPTDESNDDLRFTDEVRTS